MLKGASGVIGRVYVDTLDLSGIEGQQGFQGFKVVTLDNDVSGIRVAVAVFFFFRQKAVFGVIGGPEVLLAGQPVKGGHLEMFPPSLFQAKIVNVNVTLYSGTNGFERFYHASIDIVLFLLVYLRFNLY
jgi:hypothetical protein